MAEILTVEINKCCVCGSGNYSDTASSIDWEFRSCTNSFHFVTCNSCGHIWLRNRPAISELPVIYSSEYATYSYDQYLGGVISNIRDQVQRIKINTIKKYAPKGSTIVDVGCGTGGLLRLIKKFGEPSWIPIGVDISTESMCALSKLEIKGIQGRFETLEWDSPPPDVLIMNQVIEHLENPINSIAQAYKILNKNGILFIETPSSDGWDAKIFRERYWGGWHTPRHWNIFNEKTLSKALNTQGFEIVKIDYLLNPYAWLQSIRFMLDEKYNSKKLAKFSQVNFLPALVVSSLIDWAQKAIRTKTSNMRIIAIKR